MNMKFIGFLLLSVIGSGELMATDHLSEKEWHSTRVIRLTELDEQTTQDFFNGKMSDSVLECSEGATLPLITILKGEFLASDPTENLSHLKILKTCYVRWKDTNNLLFSTDLQDWKEFSEFFTGSIKASVQTQNGKTVAGLELELNQREAS